MSQFFSLLFQCFFRPDKLFFGPLSGNENAFRILNRDRAQEFFLVFRQFHSLPPRSFSASNVPCTRARILANAVSRVVEVSSQKGENPQSSVVPSCSIGM